MPRDFPDVCSTELVTWLANSFGLANYVLEQQLSFKNWSLWQQSCYNMYVMLVSNLEFANYLIYFLKIAASFLEIERKCLKRKVVNIKKRKIRK